MKKIILCFALLVGLAIIGVGGYTVHAASEAEKYHGGFQNNTNTCSNCHAAHTASSPKLLKWEVASVSEACLICHDGTMGFYDVSKPDADGKYGNSGSFEEGTEDNFNGSMHNIGVSLSTAPGGSKQTTSDKFPAFGGTLSCASCHSAHGSYSARLLKTDPMGWSSIEHDNATEKGQLGTLYTNIKIYNSVPTTKANPNDDMILVRFENVNINNAPFNGTGLSKQYPFVANKDIANGDDVLVTYAWDETDFKYKVNFSLFLDKTSFQIVTPSYTGMPFPTDQFLVNYKDGYFVSKGNDTTVKSITRANIPYGVGVDMMQKKEKVVGGKTITTTLNRAYYDMTSGADAYKAGDGTTLYLPESGVQMSRFCLSCHNDYLSSGGSTKSGVHMKSYRHLSGTFGQDTYSCVYCHYAHGSSTNLMRDAQDRGLAELTKAGGLFAGQPTEARNYLKDTGSSSALKRYTKNTSCFSCHAAQFDYALDPGSRDLPGGKKLSKVGYNGNGVISEEIPTNGDEVINTATGRTSKGN